MKHETSSNMFAHSLQARLAKPVGQRRAWIEWMPGPGALAYDGLAG